MAASDGYRIDLPGVGGVATEFDSLVSEGTSAASNFGSALLSGAAFAEIGSAVASASGSLEQQLLSALNSGLSLLSQINNNIRGSAANYDTLDSAVATSFGGGSTATGTGTPAAPTIPAPGTTPAAVKAWWDSLSQDQKQQITDANPAQIGSLNGVPSAVRDYANREVLTGLRQSTLAQINQLKTQPLDTGPYEDGGLAAYQSRQQDIDGLQTKLDGLNELQKVIGPNQPAFPTSDIPAQPITDGTPPKYLLGVDTNNLGHAIVASNNPDATQNVVTLVPGIHTRLNAGSIDSYTTDADTMVASAHAADPNQTTSAIAWMNYNAPQGVLPAISSGPATAAGPSIDSFQQGIYATNSSGDPHTTLIGHSYGSTAVGEAANAPGGVQANDIVLIGSPGTDTANAAAMGIDPSHVWASRDTNDVIVYAEGFHNTDPVTSAYGAHVFNSGDGPSNDFGVPAHSYYFTPGSPGMQNMGDIITGHYNQVTSPPPPKDDPNLVLPIAD